MSLQRVILFFGHFSLLLWHVSNYRKLSCVSTHVKSLGGGGAENAGLENDEPNDSRGGPATWSVIFQSCIFRRRWPKSLHDLLNGKYVAISRRAVPRAAISHDVHDVDHHCTWCVHSYSTRPHHCISSKATGQGARDLRSKMTVT